MNFLLFNNEWYWWKEPYLYYLWISIYIRVCYNIRRWDVNSSHICISYNTVSLTSMLKMCKTIQICNSFCFSGNPCFYLTADIHVRCTRLGARCFLYYRNSRYKIFVMHIFIMVDRWFRPFSEKTKDNFSVASFISRAVRSKFLVLKCRMASSGVQLSVDLDTLNTKSLILSFK